MFELERRVFEESRIQQLEDENARLRAANERLSSQVSKLGSVIRELTSDAIS
jgi:cell division protein FtsB